MPEQKPVTAEELAKSQREISISEFFVKNKHLLGFDNPRKALLTTIKEAVDNSLDACDESKILPEIYVEVSPITESDSRFRVTVEDNGPGIVKEQIPRIFAKLLYGSKFHRLKQSLAHDEPVIIQRKGKVEIIPIGKLADFYMTPKEDVKEITDIFVPAFDKDNYTYSWRNASHIIKHRRENEVIKIKTATNRTIKVTGCHSLFTEESGTIKEVEARHLKPGSKVVVPSKIPEISELTEINILEYLGLEDIKDNWLYAYGVPEEVLKDLKANSKTIHKKTSKSRRFYRINGIDILDDSFKQYEAKRFLPLHLVYNLGLKDKIKDCFIKTYYHGKETKIPVTLPLTKEFTRFLGFYIAEGHFDRRQIGLTFGKHEEKFVDETITFAKSFGLNFTIEQRETTIRIKLFGNIFTKLIKNICGKGAINKKIPEFIFRMNQEKRQDLLDAYYQGDGHNTKARNQLMSSTISERLANELLYLWLMQGVLASVYPRMKKGLGKTPSKVYTIAVYGKNVKKSNVFSCNIPTRNIVGAQQLAYKDISLLKVREIEIINKGFDYVYDFSVPGCENFVGGFGGITCHNSRGQQGIGISAAVMYAQLTTGKPTKIAARTHPKKPSQYYELHLDTKKNEPEVLIDREIPWEKDHGVKIELELEAKYQKGQQSIDEYLKQTAIVNPHLHLTYKNPEGEVIDFPRGINKPPQQPKEIKPHPYGIELGILINMLKVTKSRNLSGFLQTEFSRISPKIAKELCEKALLDLSSRPERIAREEADALYKAINETKIMAPPTDCLSPITAEAIEKGLKKEVNAEFFTAITRPPAVYRGYPFQVEVGLAYGGDLPSEEPVKLLRFANRVPLQYEQSACAITKSAIQTAWKNYNLSQSKGALPVGQAVILVHIVSVWVPFTSESKEAIASYPEIIHEIKLGLQECGRKLGSHIRKNVKAKEQKERANLFEKYIPELASSLSSLSSEKKDIIQENLQKKLKKELPNILAENGAEK